jgi:hypothetical protein
MKTIYVITEDRLTPYGDQFTVSLFESDDVTTSQEGQPDRPCRTGDVLSIDPKGYWSGRISGTSGPYELCRKVSKGLLYSPSGTEGKSFLVPYVD